MTDAAPVRVAAAQYDIGYFHHWREYCDKARSWVEEAARNDAKILLFPEYGTLELASLFGSAAQESMDAQLHALQSVLPDYLALYQQLAQQYGVYIVPGSYPVAVGERYRNRAYLFDPSGNYDFQEKLMMTRFENEQWHIEPGDDIKLFDTDYGPVAISICYDSEFPMIARRQVEMGANLILVPSCTDTLAGYYRVRIGSQARALENQCYVLHSPTVGEADWNEAVDVNNGAAAIYTPVDYGFPSDGILAIGELNQVQWVYGDLNLAKVDLVRQTGQVFNYRNWPDHLKFSSPPG